jgi:hypothetical protein
MSLHGHPISVPAVEKHFGLPDLIILPAHKMQAFAGMPRLSLAKKD